MYKNQIALSLHKLYNYNFYQYLRVCILSALNEAPTDT